MTKLGIFAVLLAALLRIASGGTVTTSAIAPTTDILTSSVTGDTDTALFDEDANANHARGQLFSLPVGSAYEVTAITVRKSTDQTYANDVLTLRIFEGTQAQWDTGTGHATGTDGSDYYVDTTVTPLHTEAFVLNDAIADNDYVTFELTTPLAVNDGSDFGFLMTYDRSAGTNPDRFRHREALAGGGRISITASDHGTSGSRRVVYFLQGTASGSGPSLKLAAPFQDGMVLQRDKPISIWGVADPNTAVSASINGQMGSGTSDADGEWNVELPALASGGPHTLAVVSGADTVTRNDVLIGDVWLAFGQSNMVRPLSEMTGKQFYIDEIETNNVPVRCLKVTQFGALTAQDEAQVPAGHYVNGAMNWLDASTSETWTSVGTVFAYRMYEATGVPTAIIWAAWGSSSIEGWMPAEMAPQLPHFEELLPDYYQLGKVGDVHSWATNNGHATNTAALNSLFSAGWTGATSQSDIFVRTRPNVIFNQMIHPLLNFGISGFVWYQGEANTIDIEAVAEYGFSFPAFIKEYRQRFQQGDLPFLGVQLPSFNESTWPWFREAQNRITSLPNAHVAVTIDTGLSGNIHPFDKEPIGVRLSLLARKYLYGESIEAHGPRFDSLTIAGDQATISFTNASGLTTDDAMDPATFEVAGSDEVFHAATSATISGNDVIISSGVESAPVAVRYAWSPAPVNQVNLVNDAGLPAAPFRSDSFALPGLGAQAPQSIDDSYMVAMDTTLNVPVDGILSNDIDLNHDPLTAVLVNDVNFGTLALLSDGSFTYTPDSGYAGPDSFTYRCSDGGLSSSDATVSVNITGQSSQYYLWKSTISWGTGDDDTPSGDPDSDGVVNFLEFALGLNPLDPDTTNLPTLTKNEGGFEFDFNNVRPGITYEVLLSSDLEDWSNPAFAQLTISSTTPVQIPAGNAVDGRLFVRLRVSES